MLFPTWKGNPDSIIESSNTLAQLFRANRSLWTISETEETIWEDLKKILWLNKWDNVTSTIEQK
jgi:hypothetical protein